MEKKAEEKKIPEKEEYLNRETLEILTQPLDISYYKLLQSEQILENRLLGTFDSLGKYSVSKEILQELLSAKKYIKEAKDNKYVLSAPTKKGMDNLFFTLTIEEEGDFSVATMRFIETNIKADGEKEILKVNVGRYKDDDDIYFMGKVKKIFNIISNDEDEEDGREIDNEEFLKIVLKRFSDIDSLRGEASKVEEFAKEYIEKIIAFLKTNPSKHSEYILRHYETFLEELKEMEGKPGYYKKLRSKLDNLLDKTVKKVKDLELENFIIESRKEYLAKVEAVHKQALDKTSASSVVNKKEAAVARPKSTVVKNRNKKAGAKKFSAKKSSGGKKKNKGKSNSIIAFGVPIIAESDYLVKEKVEESLKTLVFRIEMRTFEPTPPKTVETAKKNSQPELTI